MTIETKIAKNGKQLYYRVDIRGKKTRLTGVEGVFALAQQKSANQEALKAEIDAIDEYVISSDAQEIAAAAEISAATANNTADELNNKFRSALVKMILDDEWQKIQVAQEQLDAIKAHENSFYHVLATVKECRSYAEFYTGEAQWADRMVADVDTRITEYPNDESLKEVRGEYLAEADNYRAQAQIALTQADTLETALANDSTLTAAQQSILNPEITTDAREIVTEHKPEIITITTTENDIDGRITGYYVNGVKTKKTDIEFYYTNNPACNKIIKIKCSVAMNQFPNLYRGNCVAPFVIVTCGSSYVFMTKCTAKLLGYQLEDFSLTGTMLYKVKPIAEVSAPAVDAEIESATATNTNDEHEQEAITMTITTTNDDDSKRQQRRDDNIPQDYISAIVAQTMPRKRREPINDAELIANGDELKAIEGRLMGRELPRFGQPRFDAPLVEWYREYQFRRSNPFWYEDEYHYLDDGELIHAKK